MSAPPYTLAELLAPENLDAIRARFLGGLQGAGFPALTEWVPRAGVEMSFVDMYGSAVADKIAAELPAAVASGFLGKATDAYADLLAEKFYLNTRGAATKTTFNEDMVCASTAGPYSFEVGDVELLGASGKRYRNITRGDVAAGGRVMLRFEAVEAGAAYADDPELMTLVTTQAGLTITPNRPVFSSVIRIGTSTGRIVPTAPIGASPPPHTHVIRIDVTGDPGTAYWSLSVDGGAFQGRGLLAAVVDTTEYDFGLACFVGEGSPSSFLAGDTYTFTSPGGSGYVQGSDAESTRALMKRCAGRWSTLSMNPTEGLFLLWAKLAYQAASRVGVAPDLVVPGQTLLTMADSHGPIDIEAVGRITEYIAPRLRCILDGVRVAPATARTVALRGAVLVRPLELVAIQAAAQAGWLRYLGGTDIGGKLRLALIEDLIMDAGATDVTGLALDDSFENLQLNPGEVPVSSETLAAMLTWVYS